MKPKPPVDHLELGLFGHSRAFVTVQEASRAACVSEQRIRDWELDGWLGAMPAGGGKERQHLRLIRASVEAICIYRIRQHTGVNYYKVTPEIQMWLDLIEAKAQSLPLPT